MKKREIQLNVRITDETKDMLKAITDHDHLSQTDVIDRLIRREYKRLKARLEKEDEDESRTTPTGDV